MIAFGRVSFSLAAPLLVARRLPRLTRFVREPSPIGGAEDVAPGPRSDRVGLPGGDPSARRADEVLREVDDQHGQGLLGLAIRSGLSPDAAQDAVQEALFRLWREVRSGVEIIDPRAWTFRILYRIAMDEHRVRRRAGDIVASLSTRSWRTVDPDIAERISIWSLVDRLPTRQRQVMYLRYKADLPFEQIATVMGITASAARAHATFAAARLRTAIGEEEAR